MSIQLQASLIVPYSDVVEAVAEMAAPARIVKLRRFAGKPQPSGNYRPDPQRLDIRGWWQPAGFELRLRGLGGEVTLLAEPGVAEPWYRRPDEGAQRTGSTFRIPAELVALPGWPNLSPFQPKSASIRVGPSSVLEVQARSGYGDVVSWAPATLNPALRSVAAAILLGLYEGEEEDDGLFADNEEEDNEEDDGETGLDGNDL